MTSAEFQLKYDEYRTADRNKALRDSLSLALSDGGTVVAVQIGPEYCLMLKTAAETVAALGLAAIVSWQSMISEAGK